MALRRMELVLDELDYDTIQREIAHRQERSRWEDDGGTIIPEGDSDLAGAIIAEIIRDLDDYRDLSGSNPKLDRKTSL